MIVVKSQPTAEAFRLAGQTRPGWLPHSRSFDGKAATTKPQIGAKATQVLEGLVHPRLRLRAAR